MPKKKLPQSIEKFCVAGLGLAGGLDAHNAADVFHGGVIQRLCRGDGALELLVIPLNMGAKQRVPGGTTIGMERPARQYLLATLYNALWPSATAIPLNELIKKETA